MKRLTSITNKQRRTDSRSTAEVRLNRPARTENSTEGESKRGGRVSVHYRHAVAVISVDDGLKQQWLVVPEVPLAQPVDEVRAERPQRPQLVSAAWRAVRVDLRLEDGLHRQAR